MEDVVVYQHGKWKIILDTYFTPRGKSSKIYHTRMRARFLNKDDFYFKIYREGLFSPVGKYFGMQDIQIGDSFFDSQFIIKGNDSNKIQMFLNDKIKSLIQKQPKILFEIRSNEHDFFAKNFPSSVNELYFETIGVINDTSTLKSLFELLSVGLDNLVEMDSAYETSPDLSLN